MTMLQTQNEGHGFYGTVQQYGLDPDRAWTDAMDALTRTGYLTQDDARFLLDSRLGRHMADQIGDRQEQVTVLLQRLVLEWRRDVSTTLAEKRLAN